MVQRRQSDDWASTSRSKRHDIFKWVLKNACQAYWIALYLLNWHRPFPANLYLDGNEFTGTMEPFCVNTTVLSIFRADCYKSDIFQITPEVVCPCCSTCCDARQGCVQANTLGSWVWVRDSSCLAFRVQDWRNKLVARSPCFKLPVQVGDVIIYTT